jgi:hypothetical protein
LCYDAKEKYVVVNRKRAINPVLDRGAAV